MVFQQCLACNTLMPVFCRSCICGHVFEDMKQIGGRRFSGYRAELYNRLETKRLKSMMKKTPQRSPGMASSGDEENTDVNKVITKATKPAININNSSCFKLGTKKTKRRRRVRRSKISSSHLMDQKKSQIPSPELVARLPNALAEINRRILGQNLVWAAL